MKTFADSMLLKECFNAMYSDPFFSIRQPEWTVNVSFKIISRASSIIVLCLEFKCLKMVVRIRSICAAPMSLFALWQGSELIYATVNVL